MGSVVVGGGSGFECVFCNFMCISCELAWKQASNTNQSETYVFIQNPHTHTHKDRIILFSFHIRKNNDVLDTHKSIHNEKKEQKQHRNCSKRVGSVSNETNVVTRAAQCFQINSLLLIFHSKISVAQFFFLDALITNICARFFFFVAFDCSIKNGFSSVSIFSLQWDIQKGKNFNANSEMMFTSETNAKNCDIICIFYCIVLNQFGNKLLLSHDKTKISEFK